MAHSIILADGREICLQRPLVMGIVNVTPDSYYQGSLDVSKIRKWIDNCCASGVDILDLGAMSSRPGAQIITPKEEIERLSLVVPDLRKEQPDLLLSIDTIHSTTARQAIDWGVDMINDISFGQYDPEIWEVVRRSELPYVGMHMRGLPSTMQSDTEYEDLHREILDFLLEQSKRSEIAPGKLIWDLGIGFAKSIEQNYSLLANLDYFVQSEYPILIGLSRKSFLYRYLDITAAEALPSTSAAHMAALDGGAQILRVHDPQEAQQVIKIWTEIQKQKL